jgi:uncharacterized protein with HEPN domain
MPPKDRDAAYLWDMLQAAQAAGRFLGQVGLDEYLRNEMLQAAVERKIELIGEAARKVSDSFKRSHPEVPWKSIISQRNVVVHDYGEIKPERIWGVVTTQLPELIAKLEPLLPPLPPELDLQESPAIYRAPKAKRAKKQRKAKEGDAKFRPGEKKK